MRSRRTELDRPLLICPAARATTSPSCRARSSRSSPSTSWRRSASGPLPPPRRRHRPRPRRRHPRPRRPRHDDHGGHHDVGDHTGYAETGVARVAVLEDILAENDRVAAANRADFAAAGVWSVNVMSSPGAGKTTLLQAHPGRPRPSRCASGVLEGDIATSLDADQLDGLRRRHLARQHQQRLRRRVPPRRRDGPLGSRPPARWPSSTCSLIENVGNLVCPAEFDVGQHARAMVYAVTEGEEKPLKYPVMFRAVDVVVVNKIDLLPHLDVDLDRFLGYLHGVNPDGAGDPHQRPHRRGRRRVVRLAAARRWGGRDRPNGDHQSARFALAPPRHFLLPAVLLLIAEEPSHGYQLVKALSGLHFGPVDRPSVYRVLAQLEADGLVEAWSDAPVGRLDAPGLRPHRRRRPGAAGVDGDHQGGARRPRRRAAPLRRHRHASTPCWPRPRAGWWRSAARAGPRCRPPPRPTTGRASVGAARRPRRPPARAPTRPAGRRPAPLPARARALGRAGGGPLHGRARSASAPSASPARSRSTWPAAGSWPAAGPRALVEVPDRRAALGQPPLRRRAAAAHRRRALPHRHARPAPGRRRSASATATASRARPPCTASPGRSAAPSWCT